MIRIDLHVHTTYSADSTISPRFLVDQLYAHPTIKCVAVTDHDTLDGYLEAKKLAKAYEDIVILPGIEISAVEGHITVLGVEEKPTRVDGVESVVDFAKENGGVIVIPHPYRIMGVGDLAKNIDADAVEVLNTRSSRLENKLAEELARAKDVQGVAGTDAHHLQDLWRVYNEAEAGSDVHEVLEAIRKDRLRIGSHERHERHIFKGER